MPALNEPATIGGVRVRNRLYRAPVLEGAGAARDHAEGYARHFVPNAEAGVGLIIQGNTIVLPEGCTSPGMTAVRGREQIADLAPMVKKVHDAGARIVIQLGHGGVYSLEAWSREHMARRLLPPLAPSPVPWWARFVHRGAHVLTTEEVAALARRFGQVAAWAREAGYDAVQLAGGNAKLLHQFLSPTYNRRDDRYGGLVEKRFQLFREIRKAVAEEAGEDYPVWLKFAATEIGRPFGGYGLDMGVAVAKLAEDAGFDALTPAGASVLPNTAICRGAYPSASFTPGKVHDKLRAFQGSALRLRTTQAGFWVASKRFPFRPVWNRSIFSAVKAAVRIPVFAVGGIRTREEAEDILARGEADMVGVGRPFYAEPALAEKFLAGGELICENSNSCIVPQMLGLPGVCYDPRVNERRRASAAKAPHIRQPA